MNDNLPAYDIKEQFAWRAPTGMYLSLNQVAPEGSVKESQGFRITRDGRVMYPSYFPFDTREAAQAKIDELTK